jgi:hypothetical protein
MHKNATKCNETLSKWCKNKHGASKIIDTFETYQSSSRSATSCFFSSVGVSFHALATHVVKQEVAPGSATGVKVEVKQEAMLEVKVEVKDEPPSPPHGKSPATHALKMARTEATLPSPPPPEPWRVAFTVHPMYRRPNNGEWAGYNAVVRLSTAPADIVVIDEDEDGGASVDAKGKAQLLFYILCNSTPIPFCNYKYLVYVNEIIKSNQISSLILD